MSFAVSHEYSTGRLNVGMNVYTTSVKESRVILGSFAYVWELRKVGELLVERNEQAPMSEEYPLMAFIANEGVEYVGTVRHRESAWVDTCVGEIRQLRRRDWTLTVF